VIVLTGASAASPALQIRSAPAMKAATEVLDDIAVVLEAAEDDEEDEDEPQAPNAKGAMAASSTTNRRRRT
jgi:hypothetical protein